MWSKIGRQKWAVKTNGQKWAIKMTSDKRIWTDYGFNEISTRYGPNRIILANENQRKLIQSECTCESITEFMAGHPSGLVQICQKVSRCVRKSICNASILNNVFWLDRSSWDYTVGHLPTVVRVTPDEPICTNQLAFWRLPKRGRSWATGRWNWRSLSSKWTVVSLFS